MPRRLYIERLEPRWLLTTLDVTAAQPIGLNADGVTIDADLYLVSVTEGGRLSMSVTTDASAAPPAYVTLIDSTLTPIATSVAASASENSSYLRVDLAAVGDYFIQVDAPFAGGVEYRLQTDFATAGAVYEPNQLNSSFGGSAYAASAHLNDDNQDQRTGTGDFVDVVVAGLFGVDVMLGIGGGAFATPIPHLNFKNNLSVAFVADPADGAVEIAVLSEGLAGGDVGVEFLRVTDGRFLEPRSQANFDEVQQPSAMIAVDVDGDQITDLVLADEETDRVWIMSRDATGNFTQRRAFPAGDAPVALAHADFNRDGRVDIVAVNQASHDVAVLLSTPGGDFAVQRIPLSSPSAGNRVAREPTAVDVGDLDRDGNPDIIVANFESDDVSVLMGDGSGGFRVDPPLPIRGSRGVSAAGEFKNSVSVGDFNEDGLPDIAVTSPVDGRVAIGFGDGSGGITATKRFGLPTSVEHQFSGDFNHDGHLDLLVTTPINGNLAALVLPGSGSGGFFVPEFNLVSGVADIVAADFNGDGIPDLASANERDGSIAVLVGNGDGSYEFFEETSLGGGSEPNSIFRPVAVASGDFNGDGRADLVIAERETVRVDPTRTDFVSADTVSVLLGRGDGRFFEPARFSVHTGPRQTRNVHPRELSVSDVNGDGLDDLVVANRFSEDSIAVMFGVRGGGDSVLTPVTQQRILKVDFQPYDVLTVDVDGDDDRDIVVVGRRDGQEGDGQEPVPTLAGLMAVFANDGSGSFARREDFLIGDLDALPLRIAAGDFDNDMHTDLALVADLSTPTERVVSILFGDGSGRFQAPSALRPLPQTADGGIADGNSGIAVGDIDADGVLDVIVSDSSLPAVTVYFGNENRALALNEQRGFAADGTATSDVIVFDANVDGRLDVATMNTGSSNIGVLLNVLQNDGSTNLVAVAELLLPAAVKRPVLADVDNDGTTDSLALNGKGDVLLRIGRADEPGTFAPRCW